jgi:hypothetical protein
MASMAVFWGVSAVAFVGMGYGASLLVSALGPDVSSNTSEIPQEYGWDSLSNYRTEGGNIPLIFGTVRTAGTVLQQYISYNFDDASRTSDTEVLHTMVAICGHEIDSIENIQIESEDVDNYDDVTTYTRLGAVSETTPITGFSEVTQQTVVNLEMDCETDNPDDPDWVEVETLGDSVEKIWVHLGLPGGLVRIGSEGGYNTQHLTYKVQYRVSGSDTWIDAPTCPAADSVDTVRGGFEITGMTPEAIRRIVVIDDLEPNQYEIRAARLDENQTDSNYSDEIYFEAYTEIIKEELLYPYVAKYAISALGTDTLSGGYPAITCDATLSYVYVYDEDEEEWVQKPATNPAWICYALLCYAILPNYLYIRDMVADEDLELWDYAETLKRRVVWDEFLDWAEYCDEMLDDGEPRFQCSVIITSGNYWENIQQIARIAQGAVIHRGSKYGVFCDRPCTTVSHMFTVGNIIKETFSLEYIPQIDRANYVEEEYTDPDKDFTRQVIGVYDEEYLSGSVDKTATVSFEAILPYNQVCRDAAYRINNNKLISRVVSFDASIYSFGCRVDDLFYYQHDTIDFDTANTGGRILSAINIDDVGYVELDRDVTIPLDATCAVMVELGDGTFVEKTISTAGGTTTNTLTLTTAWATLPKKYDQYLCGETSSYLHTYRMTECSRRDDFTRAIVGIEYNDAIYTDDTVIIEDIERFSTTLPTVYSVKAKATKAYAADGTVKYNLQVSWTTSAYVEEKKWVVYIKDVTNDGNTVSVGSTNDKSLSITSYSFLGGHEYKIFVAMEGYALKDTEATTATITFDDYSSVSTPLPTDEYLEGYWSFDEGSGVVARDSKNGNNGTIEGEPSWSTVAASGKSLYFSAQSDQQVVVDGDDLPAEWSFPFWVKTTGLGSGMTTNGIISMPDDVLSIYIDADGFINAEVWGLLLTSDVSVYDGLFHMGCVTWGERLIIYLDGEEIISTSVYDEATTYLDTDIIPDDARINPNTIMGG